MQRVIWVLTILVAALPVFSAKIGTIQEVLQPQMVKVFDNELFVVEDHQIFVYSLDDFKLKQSIGKLGEGPGELTLDPSRSLTISVHADVIVAQSRTKYILFSRDGTFLKESKKFPAILQMIPVKDNFVVLKLKYEETHAYFTVNLYNGALEDQKELYRQPFFNSGGKLYMMPDPLNFCVLNDKIYVEESPDGFVIEVFDAQGKTLQKIKKDLSGGEVSDEAKEEAFDDFTKIPSFQRVLLEQGRSAMTKMLNEYDLVYPDRFPPIQCLFSDGKQLYAKTYRRRHGQEEYLAMDTSGNIKKTFFLPEVPKQPFLIRVQGDKNLFSIHDEKFYYLKMVGEDEEAWEVHMEKLG